MKKLWLAPLLACILFSAVNADEYSSTTNEGSTLDLQIGWVSASHNNDMPTLNMWKISGRYKYQTPDEFYGRVRVTYAQSGNKEKDNKKLKAKDWNLEAGLGWTFAFADAGMISPFLAIGYNNWRFTDENLTTKEKETLKIYGFCTKLGVDVQYMFDNNWSAGLVALLGIPISNKSKGSETSEKTKMSNRVFFEVLLPINYHIDDWKIGVEFSYNHTAWKGKDSNMEALTRNAFGIAFLAGLIF